MKDKQGHGGILKHGFLMILCCLLPIIVIGVLPLLGLNGSAFSFLIFLLCPLMHVGMMLMMKKNGDTGSCHGARSNNTQSDGNE